MSIKRVQNNTPRRYKHGESHFYKVYKAIHQDYINTAKVMSIKRYRTIHQDVINTAKVMSIKRVQNNTPRRYKHGESHFYKVYKAIHQDGINTAKVMSITHV